MQQVSHSCGGVSGRKQQQPYCNSPLSSAVCCSGSCTRNCSSTCSMGNDKSGGDMAPASLRLTLSLPRVGPCGTKGAQFTVPEWTANVPEVGAALTVVKRGCTIGTLRLDQHVYYLFGRCPTSPCARGQVLTLDHPTVSRLHAAVVHGNGGLIYIVDLKSSHGTFVGDQRLEPYHPVLLENGTTVSFGMSSRRYVVRVFPSRERLMARKVCFDRYKYGTSSSASSAPPPQPRPRSSRRCHGLQRHFDADQEAEVGKYDMEEEEESCDAMITRVHTHLNCVPSCIDDFEGLAEMVLSSAAVVGGNGHKCDSDVRAMRTRTKTRGASVDSTGTVCENSSSSVVGVRGECGLTTSVFKKRRVSFAESAELIPVRHQQGVDLDYPSVAAGPGPASSLESVPEYERATALLGVHCANNSDTDNSDSEDECHRLSLLGHQQQRLEQQLHIVPSLLHTREHHCLGKSLAITRAHVPDVRASPHKKNVTERLQRAPGQHHHHQHQHHSVSINHKPVAPKSPSTSTCRMSVVRQFTRLPSSVHASIQNMLCGGTHSNLVIDASACEGVNINNNMYAMPKPVE